MKKAVSMALGAILVVGSASPAVAATAVDFSGFYRADFIANGNLGFTGEDNLNENFFVSRLELDVSFQATDEVSVLWRFRAPAGQRWGNGFGEFETSYVYGQIVQDWGTVRVGRIAGGVGDEYGLSTLGWAPTITDELTYIAPFESSGDNDGIQYSNSWDNGFSIKVSYAKLADGVSGSWDVTNGSEHDNDRLQVEGAYQWEGGGAAMNVMYDRNATGNGVDAEDDPTILVPGLEDKTSVWYINPAIMHSWGAFSFHAEAKFGFGQTSYYNGTLDSGDPGYQTDTDADGQGVYLDFDYNYGPGRVNLAGWWVSGNDIDDTDNNAVVDIVDGNFYPLITAYGFVGYNASASYDARQGENAGAISIANNGEWFTSRTGIVNPGSTAVQTWTGLSGDDLADADVSGVLGVVDEDGNFNNGFLGALTDRNGDAVTINNTIEFGRHSLANDNANHWALMLSGQHSFTDEVSLNYAVGYMALANPNFRVMNGLRVDNGRQIQNISYYTQDKDLGWEIDLGVNVQLLDNLAFYSSFGYMFTGDAYKSLKGYTASVNNGDLLLNAEWEDADDAYSWLNSLVFSF